MKRHLKGSDAAGGSWDRRSLKQTLQAPSTSCDCVWCRFTSDHPSLLDRFTHKNTLNHQSEETRISLSIHIHKHSKISHIYVHIQHCFSSSAHHGCIYLIKNTVKIVKYYYNIKQLFLCDYVLNCHLFLLSNPYFQCHIFNLKIKSN